jgi:hypothetical protein
MVSFTDSDVWLASFGIVAELARARLGRLKNRRAICAALLVILLLGGATWQAVIPREPVYGGRTLSFWLQEYNAIQATTVLDASREQDIREAIDKIGTDGLPVLLRWISVTDDQWRMRFLKFASTNGFKVGYRSPAQLNRDGLIGFMLLGERATNAIGRLIEIIEDAPSALSAQCAAIAIRGMGRFNGEREVRALARCFEHSDPSVRVTALNIVKQIDGNSAIVVPALRSLLKDRLVPIRTVAATELGKFGAEASPALPELLAIAKMETEPGNKELKEAVRNALWKISPENISGVSVFGGETGMIKNGLAVENLYLECGGERSVLIWAGSPAPSREEQWGKTGGGRFHLYRGGNLEPGTGASVGEFEIAGVSTNSEINARIFCAIAGEKVFIGARNFSDDVLQVRRIDK